MHYEHHLGAHGDSRLMGWKPLLANVNGTGYPASSWWPAPAKQSLCVACFWTWTWSLWHCLWQYLNPSCSGTKGCTSATKKGTSFHAHHQSDKTIYQTCLRNKTIQANPCVNMVLDPYLKMYAITKKVILTPTLTFVDPCTTNAATLGEVENQLTMQCVCLKPTYEYTKFHLYLNCTLDLTHIGVN